MIILIVDPTSEGQTKISRLIDLFDATDRDSLDISVQLSNEGSFLERMSSVDVVIFGAGAETNAANLSRLAKQANSNAEILMFVSEKSYSGGAFRSAQLAKVRKVLPINASPLDLLQELVGVHEQFRTSGRAKRGKLVVFTQAKGGVGTTTLMSALGEACDEAGQSTLFWDLDIESRDLSRALGASAAHPQAHAFNAMLHGTKEITRESLKDAVSTLSSRTALLAPPQDIAAGMDLVGHPDSIATVHRMVELLRFSHDNILVDTAGRLGPAAGTLLRAADCVAVLVDDSLLGISAANAYVDSLVSLIGGNHEKVRMICSGVRIPKSEVARLVSGDEKNALSPASWEIPAMPADAAAEKWAGTGKTLYSIGQKSTRRAVFGIAQALGLLSADAGYVGLENSVELSSNRTTTRSFNPFSWGRLALQKTSQGQ